jgi:hypothetical protein
VEKEERDALKKLDSAERTCLFVQVDDEYHVYKLGEVTHEHLDTPTSVNEAQTTLKI